MEKTVGKGWYAKKCALGTLTALAVELALLALAALLIERGAVGERQLAPSALVAAALGSFAGCLVARARTSRRRELTLACAVSFWTLSQVIGLLFCNAPDVAQSLRLAAAIALGALGTLALRSRGRKRRAHAVPRRR